jgi:hypothetical protein
VLGMAAKKQEFTEHDLQGLKHFRSLRKLLVRLHGVGASRDKAGNRELFMDQYCVLVLIWLFNPLIKSLRGLQRTSRYGEGAKTPWCVAFIARIAFGIGRHF